MSPPQPAPSQVGCYVHYPILTPEMSSRVATRSSAHNNAPAVARSPLLTRLKLGYYSCLTAAYRRAGRRADVVLANGSWTAGHLRQLWREDEISHVVPAFNNRHDPSVSKKSHAKSSPMNSPAESASHGPDDGSRGPAVFKNGVVGAGAQSEGPRRRPAVAGNTGGEPHRGGSGPASEASSGRSDTGGGPAASPSGSMGTPSPPPGGIHIVHPPCDTLALERIPLWPRLAAPVIALSISQFRPEKDQPLQLRAFARVLREVGGRGQGGWRETGGQGRGQDGAEGQGGGHGRVRGFGEGGAHGCSPPTTKDQALPPPPRLLLILAGAVRHEGDATRLRQLHDLAGELGLRAATMEASDLAAWLEALTQPQRISPDGDARDIAPKAAAPGAPAPEPRASDSGPAPAPPSHGAASLPLDVVFAPNLDRGGLLRLLGVASVGLHTMWNEHFGIGVVELMAAGVPTVAHASGGPLVDIVRPEGEVGLLATTEEEYADAMVGLLRRGREGEERRRRMGERARQAVAGRFSEQAFAAGWCDAIRPLLEG